MSGHPAFEKGQMLPDLGIRTGDVPAKFLEKGLQTIVFAPSRLATEVLVTAPKGRLRGGPRQGFRLPQGEASRYLKDMFENRPGSEGVIRGYRGGCGSLALTGVPANTRPG